MNYLCDHVKRLQKYVYMKIKGGGWGGMEIRHFLVLVWADNLVEIHVQAVIKYVTQLLTLQSNKFMIVQPPCFATSD